MTPDNPAPHPKNLEILLHTLGLSDPHQRESYRNYFVAGDGHADMPALERLCALGLMRRVHRIPGFLDPDDQVFVATGEGKTFAMRHRPQPSLAKRRYHRYLSISDAYPDLTFREFLIGDEWSEARENP